MIRGIGEVLRMMVLAILLLPTIFVDPSNDFMLMLVMVPWGILMSPILVPLYIFSKICEIVG